MSLCPCFARRALTLSLLVLCALPALLTSRPVGAAHAAGTIPLPATFLNASSYPIVSLSVDQQQIIPDLAPAIPPGATLTIKLQAGGHTYVARNGLSDSFTLYSFRGSFVVRLTVPVLNPATHSLIIGGVTHQVVPHVAVFTDPTIAQLLTRFGQNGVWTSNPFLGGDGALHFNTFNFRTDGTYAFAVDGKQQGIGHYTLVSRNPGAQAVTFNVGGTLNGILSETQGMFLMPNDPNGNALQYT